MLHGKALKSLHITELELLQIFEKNPKVYAVANLWIYTLARIINFDIIEKKLGQLCKVFM